MKNGSRQRRMRRLYSAIGVNWLSYGSVRGHRREVQILLGEELKQDALNWYLDMQGHYRKHRVAVAETEGE